MMTSTYHNASPSTFPADDERKTAFNTVATYERTTPSPFDVTYRQPLLSFDSE